MKRTLISTLVVVWSFATPLFAYSGGAGIPTDPYQLATKADIMELAAHPSVRGSYIMTNDIDLSGEVFYRAIVREAVGVVFDGNGHKITGLMIDTRSSFFNVVGPTGAAGFFGTLRGGSLVKGLTLENCKIYGNTEVGGIAGRVTVPPQTVPDGNPIVDPPSVVADCHISGIVQGNTYVGGLAGVNLGLVTQCSSSASVSGGDRVGGLVGSCSAYSSSISGISYDSPYGSIYNSYSTGTVASQMTAGGLVGSNSGNISNCYSTGRISASGPRGGLVGTALILVGGTTPSVVVNSFWDTQTSGTTASMGGTGKTTAQMKDINTYLAAKWDFAGEKANGDADYWQMPAGGYPAFYAAQAPQGSGTPADPYVIKSAADFGAMTRWPWANFVLGNDIDLTGRVYTKAPVVPDTDPSKTTSTNGIVSSFYDGTGFYGVFDGNDHTIRGLTINDGGAGNSYLGFFGCLRMKASVRRLNIENCTISGTGDSDYVGALAGRVLTSGVRNCRASGIIRGDEYVGGLAGSAEGVRLANLHAEGSVTGRSSVGGLLGGLRGTVENCSSSDDVTGSVAGVGGLVGTTSAYSNITIGGPSPAGFVRMCWATGVVTGGNSVGGLVGSDGSAELSNCYALGPVSGAKYVGGLTGSATGRITTCYSTGPVTGASNTGGLTGYMSSSYVPAAATSFWDLQTSGQPKSAAGTGKMTAHMMSQSSFVGWDFAKVWTIHEGLDYPRFLPVAQARYDWPDLADRTGKMTLTLDGSGSCDMYGRPLAFLWRGDVNGVPFTSTLVKPTVELPAGQYTFTLAVSNGIDPNATDTCQVHIGQNRLPIAEAGPDQTFYAGAGEKVRVLIGGWKSQDPDSDSLGYLWTWTMGGVVHFSPDAKFIAELPIGVYVFALVAMDSYDISAPDTCTVTVKPKPIAEAGGDQTVYANRIGLAVVHLDGSASFDYDGMPLTYHWEWYVDDWSDSNECSPTIELPVGTYTIYLSVNNGITDSLADSCIVTVCQNTPPFAEAGPDKIAWADHTGTATVIMDGSGSYDLNGQPLNYLWSWSVAGAPFTSTEVKPAVILPPGQHTFTLLVNDGVDDANSTDNAVATVISPVRGELMMVPKVLNVKGHPKDIAAVMYIRGISKADLDPAAPVTLWPFGIQAKRKMICTVREGRKTYPVIVAFFDADSIVAAIPNTRLMGVQVETELKNGRYAVGSDFIVVLHPPKKHWK